jgi:hypothetical protein
MGVFLLVQIFLGDFEAAMYIPAYCQKQSSYVAAVLYARFAGSSS